MVRRSVLDGHRLLLRAQIGSGFRGVRHVSGTKRGRPRAEPQHNAVRVFEVQRAREDVARVLLRVPIRLVPPITVLLSLPASRSNRS